MIIPIDPLKITVTVCGDVAESVNMTGPWWSWDATAGPVASANADGTWTFTFDTPPTDDMEFLLIVDGVQEDLTSANNASGDWTCTPITDYWSYANRQWSVGSGDMSVTYGTCGSCEVVEPEPEPAPATVDFSIDMNGVDQPSADYDNVVINGSWNGWAGWGVTLADEDGDGVFTDHCKVAAGTSFEYVVAVTGSADDWSGWGDGILNSTKFGDGCSGVNGAVTAGDPGSVTSSSITPGCSEVLGCLDINASNYNADATSQGYTNGNLECVYASCEDVPQDGCVYSNGFGDFPTRCRNSI